MPCVNFVDYATSLQVMVPIFKRETGEILRAAFRDKWLSWAGPPEVLVLDPARPNLGEVFNDFCDGHGVRVEQTAAESHWQLGKVERHGQWFQRILARILDEVRPTTEEEYLSCIVQAQSAKNTLLTEAGASPYQLVFGRNPRTPQDLLQDAPSLAAVDAAASDSVLQRAQAIRQAARMAVLQCQDDRALRAALRARPRLHKPFASGDWVFYWRTQKSIDGARIEGGRWYGAAMVLGHIGKNLVVAHRKSILRCAPEQLRHATPEESTVADFPQNELLGIRNLLEKGQFPKSQFLDLVPQPLPSVVIDPEVEQDADAPPALNAAQCLAQAQRLSAQSPVVERPSVPEEPARVNTNSTPYPETVNPESRAGYSEAGGYGPVRVTHRVSGKRAPMPLHRPAEVQADEFLELMQEVVPRLIQEATTQEASASSNDARSLSPRGSSQKRSASQEHHEAPPSSALRSAPSEPVEDEALCVGFEEGYNSRIEVLMAAFLQKRMQKELPVTGNEPGLQSQVEEAKGLEWETITGKSAARVWTGAKAHEIRRKQAHRFVGSRFVVTEKVDEEGTRIKARWCLQGHSDPDFKEKIASGLCHSPTLSHLGRAVLLQLLVSNHWTVNLGDIKGAFMEAGPIQDRFRPLYAHQPPGGIPGLNPGDVIEITGNLYGSNDAPFQWFQTFDYEARAAGFKPSSFDKCLYFFHGSTGSLSGALGAHVDDTMTGGAGAEYETAIARLKQRFPYRKWRVGSGEFCGLMYHQDPLTYEITYQQTEYARHLRPITLSKDRRQQRDAPATDREINALRAINGAANWLASQSRPDLSVQTSFSQQAFPAPKVSDLLFANQLVRRAKQHAEVSVTVRDIPLDELAISCHSDAGFANAGSHQTQAGYVLAFVNRALDDDKPSVWSPFSWKSYKMQRVVASTLAGESQAFATASGVAEWVSLMVAEARHGALDLRNHAQVRDRIPIIGITDCKSLYDAIHSVSSPAKLDDKRVAIDLAIIRQAKERTQMKVRWCPTELMLADPLTKDKADSADLLRAALHYGEYQLAPEARVLEQKRQQREARTAWSQASQGHR